MCDTFPHIPDSPPSQCHSTIPAAIQDAFILALQSNTFGGAAVAPPMAQPNTEAAEEYEYVLPYISDLNTYTDY